MPTEEAERGRRRLLSRCDERLDRPRGGLTVRDAAAHEREASVLALQAPEVGEAMRNRLAAHPRRAQRLDRGRGVVRVGSAALVPRPSARSTLLPQEIAHGCRRNCATGRAQREHSPDGRVDERADAPVGSRRQPGKHRVGVRAERSQRERPQRDVRGIVGGLGGQVGGGARGGLPCGGEAEHGPRRQFGSRPAARLGEAAVRLLARAQIRGRGDGDRQRDERSLQAHTTSVCRRRP